MLTSLQKTLITKCLLSAVDHRVFVPFPGNTSELLDLTAWTNSTDLVCIRPGATAVTVIHFCFFVTTCCAPACQRYLGLSHQSAVSGGRGSPGGCDLCLRAWHHPHVADLVLRNLHLLHGSEKVQDEPFLPDQSEFNTSGKLCCLDRRWSKRN